LEDYRFQGYETKVVTDNMIAYCLSKGKIEQIFLFYLKIEGDVAYCRGGSLLVSVLARELGVPSNLYPADGNEGAERMEEPLRFFDRNITPEGVKSFVPGMERVALNTVAERW
jgi:hypothetical protein